ncbi:hypothetical protein JL722_9405 [Aureococcus anophagefferens]|nr:hypothetical protein JL722_9405 [Aureococcus anophagefferens]
MEPENAQILQLQRDLAAELGSGLGEGGEFELERAKMVAQFGERCDAFRRYEERLERRARAAERRWKRDRSESDGLAAENSRLLRELDVARAYIETLQRSQRERLDESLRGDTGDDGGYVVSPVSDLDDSFDREDAGAPPPPPPLPRAGVGLVGCAVERELLEFDVAAAEEESRLEQALERERARTAEAKRDGARLAADADAAARAVPARRRGLGVAPRARAPRRPAARLGRWRGARVFLRDRETAVGRGAAARALRAGGDWRRARAGPPPPQQRARAAAADATARDVARVRDAAAAALAGRAAPLGAAPASVRLGGEELERSVDADRSAAALAAAEARRAADAAAAAAALGAASGASEKSRRVTAEVGLEESAAARRGVFAAKEAAEAAARDATARLDALEAAREARADADARGAKLEARAAVALRLGARCAVVEARLEEAPRRADDERRLRAAADARADDAAAAQRAEAARDAAVATHGAAAARATPPRARGRGRGGREPRGRRGAATATSEVVAEAESTVAALEGRVEAARADAATATAAAAAKADAAALRRALDEAREAAAEATFLARLDPAGAYDDRSVGARAPGQRARRRAAPPTVGPAPRRRAGARGPRGRRGRRTVVLAAPPRDGVDGGAKPRKLETLRFDRVFDGDATQADVYGEIDDLVASAADGFDVCVLAYGATGSGKTHTMHGPASGGDEAGVVPRATRALAEAARRRGDGGWSFACEASSVEIYDEKVYDLLAPGGAALEVKDDADDPVPGAAALPLDFGDDGRGAAQLAKRAARSRRTAATLLNDRSSRSHALFTLRIVGHYEAKNLKTRGSLVLVDLAGSERLKRSGAADPGADPGRLREACAINRSLSCLVDVFAALGRRGDGRGRGVHVPYRNSALTRILQRPLSGDGKALLLATCNPHEAESLGTLKFAHQVAAIETGRIARRVSSAAKRAPLGAQNKRR